MDIDRRLQFTPLRVVNITALRDTENPLLEAFLHAQACTEMPLSWHFAPQFSGFPVILPVINPEFDAYTFLNRKEVVSMPEYRRFISYFYEYIDGKKQRNTGFAKVELRNGVWRVLFRLTVPVQPEPPVEVFGFMREGEKLTGFSMGTMRAAREMTEEWAYRADRPVWAGKYGLSDISGLWIQSGDGRCFATVWDDEPVDPAQFVKYGTRNEEPAENMENMPKSEAMKPDDADIGEMRNMERVSEPAESEEDMSGMSEWPEDEREKPETPDSAGMTSEWPEGEREKPEVPDGAEMASEWPEDEREKPEMPDGAEMASEWSGGEGEISGQSKVLEFSGNEREIPKQSEDCSNIENVPEQPDDAGEMSELSERRRCVSKQLEDMGKASKLVEENKNVENRGTWKEEAVTKSEKQGSRNSEDDRLWRDLYRKRAQFQPFSDQEISSCIRVVPGDIVVLQNAHWRTGKNNFLLHGYHNYRHLLIGKSPDGGYVLGVPGIMNPQEKYMAAMFGFPDFKYADNQEGNPSFGYWYRPLRREDQ